MIRNYYHFDGDYNVNEPSYYDWLAKVNKKPSETKFEKYGLGTIKLPRLFRDIRYNGLYRKNPDNTVYMANTQGMCVHPNGNILQTYVQSGSTLVPPGAISDDATLVEYSPSGVKLREVVLKNGGHCNGVTFNPLNNELIISQTSTPTGGTSNKYYRVPYDTLTFDGVTFESIQGIRVPCIKRDRITGKYWTWDRNHVGEQFKMYQVDIDKHVIIKGPIVLQETDIRIIGDGVATQTVIPHNDSFYQLTFLLNGIGIYNSKGEREQFITLPPYVDHSYLCGEVEDGEILENGDIILSIGGTIGVSIDYRITQFCKTRLDNDVIEADIHTLQVNVHNEAQLYLDPNTTVTNPIGTADRPFKYMFEICDFMRSEYGRHFGSYEINMFDGDHYYFYMTGQDNVRLQPNAGSTNVNIKGMAIRSCSGLNVAPGVKFIQSDGIYDNLIDLYNTRATINLSVDFSRVTSKTIINAQTGTEIKFNGVLPAGLPSDTVLVRQEASTITYDNFNTTQYEFASSNCSRIKYNGGTI